MNGVIRMIKRRIDYIRAYSPYDNRGSNGLPTSFGDDGIARLPSTILGAGKVGSEVTNVNNKSEPALVKSQHGSRPWGNVRPIPAI